MELSAALRMSVHPAHDTALLVSAFSLPLPHVTPTRVYTLGGLTEAQPSPLALHSLVYIASIGYCWLQPVHTYSLCLQVG